VTVAGTDDVGKNTTREEAVAIATKPPIKFVSEALETRYRAGGFSELRKIVQTVARLVVGEHP
jgi:hypothetical protein